MQCDVQDVSRNLLLDAELHDLPTMSNSTTASSKTKRRVLMPAIW